MRFETGSSKSLWVLVAIGWFGSTGCSRGHAGGTSVQPVEVRVATAQQRDVPIYKEWIGTLDGLVNADIKAQVSGYLIQQAYKEGSFVKKGQLLFQIDPRPFQATLDQAKAQLSQAQGQLQEARAQETQAVAGVAVAEANQRRTQLDVDRYTPLVQQQAITQQDFDNATQNNMAAKAQVEAAHAQVETAKAQIVAAGAAVEAAAAAVETARINLGFTHITSPIEGIPGIALLQVGALVSPASGAMTTVSTLDPIKCYFTVSEQEYLAYVRRFPTARELQAAHAQLELELILGDGSTYPYKGKFDFADRQVDVRTGAIRLAGLYPNPGNVLRPGQYGRVRTASRVQEGAVLVPQEAVMELQGTRLIATVGADNKVSIHPVELGDTTGRDWIVLSGVQAGQRVVVEGTQKIRQGAEVEPKPWGGE